MAPDAAHLRSHDLHLLKPQAAAQRVHSTPHSRFRNAVLFAFNFLWSLKFGKKRRQIPGDNGMECRCRPRATRHWERTPNVYRGPYESARQRPGDKASAANSEVAHYRDPVPAPCRRPTLTGDLHDEHGLTPSIRCGTVPGRARRRGVSNSWGCGSSSPATCVFHRVDRLVHRAALRHVDAVGAAGRRAQRAAHGAQHLPADLLVRFHGQGVRRDRGRQEVFPAEVRGSGCRMAASSSGCSSRLCGAGFVGVQLVEYIKLVGHGFTPSGYREGSLLAEHASPIR